MRISDWSSDVCSSDLDIGRPADEPDILRPRRRARLAEHRHAEVAQALRGAALDDAFEHVDDLIGGQRVHELLARGGEARHRPAVPVGRVAALARFPVLWQAHLAAALLDIDIGRSSGQERVFHYGYISVEREP